MIILKVKLKDPGVLGAFQVFQNDYDLEAFKAKIIHIALSPQISEISSNATTANYNWSNMSRSSTAGGRP